MSIGKCSDPGSMLSMTFANVPWLIATSLAQTRSIMFWPRVLSPAEGIKTWCAPLPKPKGLRLPVPRKRPLVAKRGA